MKNIPRVVQSKQTAPHEDLLKLLARHRHSEFKRPIAEHTTEAFEQAVNWLEGWQGEVIIDACCGVGESTARLARRYPKARIIGIDKSAVRLKKHGHYSDQPSSGEHERIKVADTPNYLILQADLNDFWRLLSSFLHRSDTDVAWHIGKQYILYPNPYPKKSQVGKRWHASPVFPAIIACCNKIEVRSNWRIYLEEFALSAEYYGVNMEIRELKPSTLNPAMTPFERKYANAGQTLWSATTLGTGSDK